MACCSTQGGLWPNHSRFPVRPLGLQLRPPDEDSLLSLGPPKNALFFHSRIAAASAFKSRINSFTALARNLPLARATCLYRTHRSASLDCNAGSLFSWRRPNRHIGTKLLEARVRNAVDCEQFLDPAKRPAHRAKLDDRFRRRRSNSRKLLELLESRHVQIERMGRRPLLRGNQPGLGATNDECKRNCRSERSTCHESYCPSGGSSKDFAALIVFRHWTK